MRHKIFVILLVVHCFPAFKSIGQFVQNDVVASAGGEFTYEYLQIGWTLGESFIETYHYDKILINQGFHQPFIVLSEIITMETPVFHAKVFPNPTSRYVVLELPGSSEPEKFRVVISEVTGTVITDEMINGSSNLKIDLLNYPSGVLLLTVIRITDNRQRSFKIVSISK